MNPTPPLPPAQSSNTGHTPLASGDLPPLNARFVSYLDKNVGERTRRRIILNGILTALMTLGTLCIMALAFIKGREQVLPVVSLPLVLIWRCGQTLMKELREQKQQERTRRVVQNGVPVVAYLVQANQALFSPGPWASLPCLVLFSFQPEVADDSDYMAFLAHKLFGYKDTTPGDADGKELAHLTTDERAVFYRRRKLPISFTDGSTVFCADLWIKRAYVPGGHLQGGRLLCIAEPGETGGLELVPSFLL